VGEGKRREESGVGEDSGVDNVGIGGWGSGRGGGGGGEWGRWMEWE
jgi:hypothetical protein